MPATAQRSAPILTAGERHPFHAGFPEHIKLQLFYTVKKRLGETRAHPTQAAPAQQQGWGRVRHSRGSIPGTKRPSPATKQPDPLYLRKRTPRLTFPGQI